MAQLASPFNVDHDGELPVGVQLEWRLRALIASGRLAPGEKLPSVRSLAEWAGVNVNTVRAVYAGLEQRGIVASRHGAGTFVAADHFSPELERIAADAIDRAREAGADPRELARVAFVCAEVDATAVPAFPGLPDDPGDPEQETDPADAGERRVRDELRRQIAHLETQLASHPRGIVAPDRPGRPVGRMISTSELEATRDGLISRLAEARGEQAALGEQQRRAREIWEEMLIDPAGHRWESVSDAEIGEQGCREYSVGAGPLGALMSWWRLKVSGGCPLSGSA
jgi:GntR family transcriptional regulator